jgi:DNA-binding beta-propeller fold protein YncE
MKKSKTVSIGSLVKDHLEGLAKESDFSMIVWYPNESAIREDEIKVLVPNFNSQDDHCYVVSFDNEDDFKSAKLVSQKLIKDHQLSIDFYNKKRKEK